MLFRISHARIIKTEMYPGKAGDEEDNYSRLHSRGIAAMRHTDTSSSAPGWDGAPMQ